MENEIKAISVISIAAILLASSTLVLAWLPSAGSVIQPTQKTFYMTAIEPKGTTSVDKEPFPAVALPAGGGYALKPVNEEGKWTVETYRWNPSVIVVNEGDEVTLEILGVNGALHPATIEGYGIDFTVQRGQLTTVTFIADKAGTFRIACSTHVPSMTGQLIVLPA